MNATTTQDTKPEGVCRCGVQNWQRPPHLAHLVGLWFCGACEREYAPGVVRVVSGMVRRIVGMEVTQE